MFCISDLCDLGMDEFRNLPVDTLERLEVNRELLADGFVAQSQVHHLDLNVAHGQIKTIMSTCAAAVRVNSWCFALLVFVELLNH